MVESSPLALAQQLENELITIGTIEQGKESLGKPFPLVLTPRKEKVNFVQLQTYVLQNRSLILKCASEYGAVLFKGFDIKTGEEWGSVLYKAGLKEMLYKGIAVRRLIVGNSKDIKNVQVVTTNESPPQEPIPFHHELAQTPNPCSHISFFCYIKAASGGATPILRSDGVMELLNTKYPELVPKFEDGVKYVRRVPEVDDVTSAIGRSWKKIFNVETREECDIKLQEQYESWEWIQVEDGSYDMQMVSKPVTAVRVSSNGGKTFFNQVVAAYTGWPKDHRNKNVKTVIFKDNSEIPPQCIADIEEHMNTNAVFYPWQEGDFVIVDNTVSYHSREPFWGRRVIFASIADGTKEPDFDQLALTLSNGDYLPQVGLSLDQISKDQASDATYDALKNKIRFIDSAANNGNEKEVGQGIKKAIDEGLVARKDLYVGSKLWSTHHRKEHVKEAVQRTLEDLGLEYLDLYTVHYPVALQYVPHDKKYPAGWNNSDKEEIQPDVLEDQVPFKETWEALEDLVDQGLIRSIGVSNIGLQLLRDLLSYAKVKPTVIQVETHPHFTQESLFNFCRQQGIAVVAMNPLANNQVLNEETIKQIAKETGLNERVVALRWATQRGTAFSLSTTDKSHFQDAVRVNEVNLKEEHMNAINSLNQNKRYENTVEENLKSYSTFLPLYD